MKKINITRRMFQVSVGIATLILMIALFGYTNSEEYEIETTQPEKYQALMERIKTGKERLTNSQDPQDILIQLGTYYEELGDYSEALKYYKKAIEINELHVIPWTNMASIYKKQGKYRKAKNIYEKTIKMFPKDTQSYHNLVDLYMKYNIGSTEEILQVIKQGVAETGDNKLIEIESSLEKGN